MLQGTTLSATAGCARSLCRGGLVGALLLVIVFMAPSPASAKIGDVLVQFGELGSGAGQLDFTSPGVRGAAGIAADPDTGHLFVAENGNNRVSEFTAWGEFVKAWGWGVADGASLESQACSVTCFEGMSGSGVGQMDGPSGIALSPSGDVYVMERPNHRIQVFDPEGNFLRMIGGGVNSTTGADVCTKADIDGGDVCGAGSEGTGPSEFELSSVAAVAGGGDVLEIGPDEVLYAGDKNRIQKFSLAGTHLADLPLPKAGEPGSLSIDPSSGDLFFAFAKTFEASIPAYRLSSTTGAVVYPLPVTAAESLVAIAGGGLFLSDDIQPTTFNGQAEQSPLLREVGPLGEIVESCCHSSSVNNVRPRRVTMATNVVTAGGAVDLYIAYGEDIGTPVFIEMRGPAPDKWPPPVVPPEIVTQAAATVGETTASLGARINPRFWDDTSYWVEYGTSACSLGGCLVTPAPPGNLLGGGIVQKPIATEPVPLAGLQPGTTYHFRFVAESGGGGPVFGPDRTFTTFAPEGDPSAACANQPFRTGASAGLADCRAYELVSPIDKLDGDIVVQCNTTCHPARLNQGDPAGEKITYSSYRAFGDSVSAGYTSQYMATRTGAGWSNDAIAPPKEGDSVYGTDSLDSRFRAFLEDLSSGWLLQDSLPLLAPGAQPNFANAYRWIAGSDSFETVTQLGPAATAPDAYNPEVQGFSSDGIRTVFAANGKLTANAVAGGAVQVYESFPGVLRLASLRPNGTAASGGASVGSRGGSTFTRSTNVATAVSDDGLKIYWTEAASPSRLYVRVNGTETVAVSAGTGDATFWAANPAGSEALYAEGSELKLFDLTSKSSSPIAPNVSGVLGSSEDLSRVYFVSSSALAGGAVASQRNLYLYEEGQPTTFIATLSEGDFKNEPALSPTAVAPWRRVARVAPDGSAAVFMSRAPLTGEDNLDSVSGEADAEVFRYDAADDDLRCISCSPTDAAPNGREFIFNKAPTGYWYASQIRGWEFSLHAPRVISEDGSRVFFESFNALVPADTNLTQDVYQWEAPGSGECAEGGFGYQPEAGGCVSLISSGKDGADSEFIDASANGSDVFFATGASLVPWDPAQVDIYDARIGGGFPPPSSPPAECVGEACQPQTPPPALPTIGSGAVGAGNPKPPPKCKKGFVRKKGKCVKKHQKGKKHKKGHKSKGQRK